MLDMSEENKKEKNVKTDQERAHDRRVRAAKRQKILRKHRMKLAAIGIAIIAVIVLIILFATGVIGGRAKTTTLTLQSDGKVVFEEITSFDKDYYDKAELKTYINDTIKEYNDANDGSIEFKGLKIRKDSAYAKYIFSDVATYSNFTSDVLYSGTVKQAIADGCDFSDTFCKVEDGEKSDDASTEDVEKNKKYKVLIVRDNINVKVPGEIVFVSDSCTSMVSKNQVAIAQPDGNDDATVLTYIIYKEK